MANKVLTKVEIYRRVARYLEDPNKIMAVRFFAELCGCSEEAIYRIFRYKNLGLSESMQIRVSGALGKMERGEVRVMQNQDRTRTLHYVKTAKPVMQKSCRLDIQNGKISLSVGLKNRGDYSEPDLMEKAKWRF